MSGGEVKVVGRSVSFSAVVVLEVEVVVFEEEVELEEGAGAEKSNSSCIDRDSGYNLTCSSL